MASLAIFWFNGSSQRRCLRCWMRCKLMRRLDGAEEAAGVGWTGVGGSAMDMFEAGLERELLFIW